MISKLHHITQSNIEGSDPLVQIEDVCKAGGKCSQLRIKDISTEDYIKIAIEAKKITTKYDVQLIINDNIEVAKFSKADGLHLGKGDSSTSDARKILGQDTIIGRTCNTFEDILFHCNENIQYIGLGPYKFTNTKDTLSPILGISGYTEIIKLCQQHSINIPIIAIGGIQLEDIKPILQTGIYGIALASALNIDKETIKEYIRIIEK